MYMPEAVLPMDGIAPPSMLYAKALLDGLVASGPQKSMPQVLLPTAQQPGPPAMQQAQPHRMQLPPSGLGLDAADQLCMPQVCQPLLMGGAAVAGSLAGSSAFDRSVLLPDAQTAMLCGQVSQLRQAQLR